MCCFAEKRGAEKAEISASTLLITLLLQKKKRYFGFERMRRKKNQNYVVKGNIKAVKKYFQKRLQNSKDKLTAIKIFSPSWLFVPGVVIIFMLREILIKNLLANCYQKHIDIF